jgi:hypothetical protein
MLRSGNSLRFSAMEIESCRRVGLDVEAVHTSNEFAALLLWLDGLGDVRPDPLERFVGEMARAKGVAPPPRAVPRVQVSPRARTVVRKNEHGARRLVGAAAVGARRSGRAAAGGRTAREVKASRRWIR